MSEFPELYTLWNYNDPAGTAVRFEELLPAVEASADRAYHVALLSQIARTYSLRRQFTQAHERLDKAEALLTDEMVVPQMRCLLERGRAFTSAGEPEKALPLFEKAFALGTAVSPQADYHTIDAAHMVAIADPDPADRIKWNERALALAEETPNERATGWRGSLYNNLGWTYHDMGDFARALVLFEKAVVWREAVHPDQPEAIRIAKWCVGRTLRSLARWNEALSLQRVLLAEYQGVGRTDGFVNEEIGECLLALNREAEARPYFAQAYTELSQQDWLESERLARLQQLGTG